MPDSPEIAICFNLRGIFFNHFSICTLRANWHSEAYNNSFLPISTLSLRFSLPMRQPREVTDTRGVHIPPPLLNYPSDNLPPKQLPKRKMPPWITHLAIPLRKGLGLSKEVEDCHCDLVWEPVWRQCSNYGKPRSTASYHKARNHGSLSNHYFNIQENV